MAAMQRLATTAVVLLAGALPAQALYQNGSTFTPCDSPVYCTGELLKQVELARPFSDSKTFVDLPTIKPLDEVLAAFEKLEKPLSNNTALQEFLSTYFGEAGSELEEVPVDQLETDPIFLDNIEDSVIKQFVEKVIDIWPDLTRKYVGADSCDDCVDSYIPINRTFVVAGGRFREPYYWDSFWILEGLLRTGGSFTEISRNIIENFLDFVDQFGFVPNGARIYYLNRSQPPLLTQMVKTYVEYTNDTSILHRALPLLIKEHSFWTTNRTVQFTVDGETHSLAHYAVVNTEPRPESYREDYVTANNRSYYAQSGIIYPETHALNDSEKADLYANLASGAESGWDYTSRWIANPSDAVNDVYFPLRSLNTVNVIGVDVNSILYANEIAIANYLRDAGDDTTADEFEELAKNRSASMFELMWNDKYSSYFDFNLTSNAQNVYTIADEDTTDEQRADAPDGYQIAFSPAQFYPFWLGAAPVQVKNNPLAVRNAYKRVAALLSDKAGAIASTNLKTGQQWDEPNVWPPLMYAIMKGLLNTPATFGKEDPYYIETQDLALSLAQRYLDSTFCTWRSTGGSTDELPRLGGIEDPEAQGIMFEKYSDASINVAGSGGEYEVVEGFGWSNGVLIWAVDTFGNKLKRPDCGDLEAADLDTRESQRAVYLSRIDARWTKKFGRRAQ
ncbi:Six-hairpin glycosidase-like protein [Xylaria bambusicola]|uniref:Six-hairpin glycosidase-like protein n=1 Tax=Xylaria bambusicola TaxID=326684 RepID=UPI002008907F|nr:Six-hairpin glycosidase-like protein [Xylaria bambusicola]KAI0526081.1 Six-hairpin glycosidase-like protein [Xylaria bambusicola]